MELNRSLEQHIAVFGESGSGKTVLVSSFYGAAQEPQFLKKSLFRVVADDPGQGTRLSRKYLGMKNSGKLPESTRFASESFAFSVKLKDRPDAKVSKSGSFDDLRLVWHDYPGEWFEEDVSTQEESQRKIDTFRSLLGSDVALLLVDGQRLLDNTGEEERYLKSLFTNFRNGLLSLKDELLDGGRRLVQFPRIWILGMSKSDLLPDWDVFRFRDLILEKAGEDVNELRNVLAELVEDGGALSVGEDFVLLSSAKFQANRIEVSERVGLDLIMPLSITLPLERHVRWVEKMRSRGKVAESLLGSAEKALAFALVGRRMVPGKVGIVLNLIPDSALNDAAKLAGDKLKGANAAALAKHEYLTATLTGFRMDLDKSEEEQILLRSSR
ncbi:TRAFAC clade GTPase domain-containing protein [Agromyces humatus]|uniref:ATP-binding protein n=1 Tax=Agromyces humatus TaxID=279573 RepID=A0ABP4X3W5_9MICO|nr:ATP/GTP-binding protein [Agromyces humatus]